jgi:hypothetical protein
MASDTYYKPFVIQNFASQPGTVIEAWARTHPDYKRDETEVIAFQFVQSSGFYDLYCSVASTKKKIAKAKAEMVCGTLSAYQALCLKRDLQEELARVEFYETGTLEHAIGPEMGPEVLEVRDDRPEAPSILRTQQIFLPLDFMSSLKDNHDRCYGRSYEYFRANVRDLATILEYSPEEVKELLDFLGATFYPTQFTAIQRPLLMENDQGIHYADEYIKASKTNNPQHSPHYGYTLQAHCVDITYEIMATNSLLTAKKFLHAANEKFLNIDRYACDPNRLKPTQFMSNHYSSVSDCACQTYDNYTKTNGVTMN